MHEEGATHTFVVPTMLKRIMEVPNFDNYNLNKLQLITYGAAPMPYEVVRKRLRHLPDVRPHERLRPDGVHLHPDVPRA